MVVQPLLPPTVRLVGCAEHHPKKRDYITKEICKIVTEIQKEALLEKVMLFCVQINSF